MPDKIEKPKAFDGDCRQHRTSQTIKTDVTNLSTKEKQLVQKVQLGFSTPKVKVTLRYSLNPEDIS